MSRRTFLVVGLGSLIILVAGAVMLVTALLTGEAGSVRYWQGFVVFLLGCIIFVGVLWEAVRRSGDNG